MKARPLRLAFYMILLIQISCSVGPRRNGALTVEHRPVDYPCPRGTLKMGDPRFPKFYTCEKLWPRETSW